MSASPNTKLKINIDGKELEVDYGTTILAAAQQAGISIPTLCYSPLVEPYAVCRLCSVEVVRGKRHRIVTACNYPITAEITIYTNNQKVQAIRKTILELLLAQAPKAEIVRQLAQQYGINESRFPVGNPEEKCILCGLCVRVCEELVGAAAIGFSWRGTTRKVSPPFEEESPACIACGACAYVCPTGAITLEDYKQRKIIHSELFLGPTTAIRVPSLQAVPNAPVIDKEHCIHFITGECGHCAEVCEPKAINYDMKDEEVTVQVGNIIITTGYDQFDPIVMEQFGYGRFDNVLTALEFERLNCAAGPTGGRILLANGEEPKAVAILHCIGSRDKNYFEYCSRVCCMYALKYGHLIKEKTEAEVYNFYIDMRCFGKGYEEFYHRLLDEGVRFIRGKAAEVTDFPLSPNEKGKLIVRCEDTLAGVIRRVPVDMVILCAAIKSRQDAKEVSRIFSCSLSPDGFFLERHPKLAPVSTNTDGIFIAGCCQGPKDIPDSVAQGAAAASAVLSLISKGKVEIDAAISEIDENRCSGCRICNALCPYSAIEFDEVKKVSRIIQALCKGCGTCVAACPRGCITAKHFTDRQILSEIEGVLRY